MSFEKLLYYCLEVVNTVVLDTHLEFRTSLSSFLLGIKKFRLVRSSRDQVTDDMI